MGKYQAVIFDLDGVLCSTDEYHYQAWKQMADAIGVPFNRETNARLRGVSRMESLDIILESCPNRFSPAEKQELAEQKNEAYKELLKKLTPADVLPEVRSTLAILHSRGLKLAIGSSSKNTPFILQQTGLGHAFDAVSDGNNIVHSKPDPEVFLKAAKMLCQPPETCLVVEDAVAGVQAAHAGGMKAACVGNAAACMAGDYNLTHFSELQRIL